MSDSLVNRIPPLVKGFGFGMFCLGATLALGVVLGSQSIGQAIARFNKDSPIQVKGLAEAEVISDHANWSATVHARAKTLPEAFEILEAGTKKLTAFIASKKILDIRMSTAEVNTRIIYSQNSKGSDSNKIESYLLSQVTTIWSETVTQVRELAFSATDLIKEGVEIDSGRPNYYVSVLDTIKLDLLEKATLNGYARATVLAKGSKSSVGGLISASQGVFQIVPAGSTDVSDYGNNDTSAMRKTVRATVSLSYSVSN